MESERFEYVGGKKSGSQLIYLISEKQLYKKKSSYKDKLYYTCYNVNCNARVAIFANGDCMKCKKNSEHPNHSNQEDLYMELISLNNIKKRWRSPTLLLKDSNSLAEVRKVFRSECER